MIHKNTPITLPDHQAVLLVGESLPLPSNYYSLYNHGNWPYKNLVSFRSFLRHVSFVHFLSPRECFKAEEIAIQQGIDWPRDCFHRVRICKRMRKTSGHSKNEYKREVLEKREESGSARCSQSRCWEEGCPSFSKRMGFSARIIFHIDTGSV